MDPAVIPVGANEGARAAVALPVQSGAGGCDPSTITLFAVREFVEAWCRGGGGRERPLAISVEGSGPPRSFYGVQTRDGLGRKSIRLGTMGLAASPGWQGDLRPETVQGIARQITGLGVAKFVWRVRHDHEPLAQRLGELHFLAERPDSYVIPLCGGYERVFGAYSRTMRNQMHRTRRTKAVLVREAESEEDVLASHRIYAETAASKQYGSAKPAGVLLEIAKLRGVGRFLVAEYEGKVVAGGLFLRDGSTVVHVHTSSDREYARFFPSYALVDEAIRWSCETGAVWFDYGECRDNEKLAQFKQSWGARPTPFWRFEWANPLWSGLQGIRGHLSSKAVGDH